MTSTQNTPVGVLRSIARTCGCTYDDIEGCLEKINDDAGLSPKPIARKIIAEDRLDEIRRWLRTPEACGVIERASEYVRQMSAP